MEDSPPLGPRTSDHLVSAEELCKTAFWRRNPLETAAVAWPRKDNRTLIGNADFMGNHTLSVSWSPEVFLSEPAVGVKESGK